MPQATDEALDIELANWAANGRTPRLYLRDDDAVCDSDALQKLFRFCEENGAPLLLASVPEPTGQSLGLAVRAFPLCTGAVHGYRHASHSPKGEKPCELGRHRPVETVLDELKKGREKLADLFDGRLSGLLVPPWNRIHDEVAIRAAEVGFRGISAHGWLLQNTAHRLATVNAHIDIIHWSGGIKGRDWPWIATELLRALREARLRGYRAIGILTHHLAHDDAAWVVLDAIGGFAARNRLQWVAADELIAEPTEQPAPLADQA
jgi:hypothetical protein